MAHDTEQAKADLQPPALDHTNTNAQHHQTPSNLCISATDSASDNDTSDRVREKLKKTSIATLPKTDTAAPTSGSNVELGSPNDTKRSLEQETLNQTPSPTSETRGRLSRKRSHDDSIEPTAKAAGISPGNPQLEDDTKHARKRSRDVRPAQSLNTKSAAIPTEELLQEGQSSSDEALENDIIDQDREDPVHSPRKKRSREDIDTDLPRGQKIAATDEAKANRRSEESERSQTHPQDDSGEPLNNAHNEQTHQASGTEAVQQQAESSAADLNAAPSIRKPAAPQKEAPQADEADQTTSSKAPTSFATSGFAAMSGSSTSPFGAFGGSRTSVFGSKPASNLSAAGPATIGMDGAQKTQTSSSSTFSKSPSPFLSSASATTGSGFGLNGAAAKPTGFGGSVFGSGFGNPTAGAPRLSSFAAPASDVAVPKTTENTTAFGAPADDSTEEDGGSEGDANPEETDAGHNETDSRFQQQEVDTGEAGEESLFLSPRAQLYIFDSGGWKEKGKGAFKLNVSDVAGEKKARFIMRAHQTFRVLLNQPVFKKMQVGDRQGKEPQGKHISFAVIDQGRPLPHLLKLGDEGEAKKLYREVMKLQQDLESQA
ncbi:MAG: hypothetical protein Q9182_007665 [Xanthomendoza sp. 2 TL-2023]